jgi:hypothetical protein
MVLSSSGASEPFRPDERDAEIDEQQGGDQGGQVNHGRLPQILPQPSANARQAATLARPSTKRAGNQTARFIVVILKSTLHALALLRHLGRRRNNRSSAAAEFASFDV